jgi:hypothetical protein
MPTSVPELLGRINQYILNPIIVLMFLVALVVFFWGLVELIRDAGGEGKETGRRHIMWGIVGLFIMVAVYGIIRIILSTFGLSSPEYILPLL